jgi:hypothetical protein
MWKDGRTDRQRETDMTKLIVNFRNLAKTLKNDRSKIFVHI